MSLHALSTLSLGNANKWQFALTQLLDAAFYAQDLGQPIWDFAVEVHRLTSAGLTANDLRWLRAKGYIEEATEITNSARQVHRRFRPTGSPLLGPRTCIILTEAGAAFAQKTCRLRATTANRVSRLNRQNETAAQNPCWDAAGRMLWLGPTLIKHFTAPAGNQELILAVFEEEHWPICIDDPLPPTADTDHKHRLHDTVFWLNQCHERKRHLIRFTSNGNGLGIHWEHVPRRRGH
jgi:hypothetical protein